MSRRKCAPSKWIFLLSLSDLRGGGCSWSLRGFGRGNCLFLPTGNDPGRVKPGFFVFLTTFCRSNGFPRSIRRLPRLVRSLPRCVRRLPRTLRQLPRIVRNRPRTVRRRPRPNRQAPRVVRHVPRRLRQVPRRVRQRPRTGWWASQKPVPNQNAFAAMSRRNCALAKWILSTAA